MQKEKISEVGFVVNTGDFFEKSQTKTDQSLSDYPNWRSKLMLLDSINIP